MKTVGTAVDRVSLCEEAVKHSKAKERIECTSMPEWLLEGDVAAGCGGENAKTVTWPRREMFIVFIRFIICFSRW